LVFTGAVEPAGDDGAVDDAVDDAASEDGGRAAGEVVGALTGVDVAGAGVLVAGLVGAAELERGRPADVQLVSVNTVVDTTKDRTARRDRSTAPPSHASPVG
jgi:hypothetical protein